MRTYTTFSTLRTPQTEVIPLEDQVENNAGGFVYKLDDFKALERFLVLGSEGGTYYVDERNLTKENALRTMRAIQLDGKRAVDLIVAVSDAGRAPKNDPAIFALALAAAAKDPATRSYALLMLPRVCRIPTHLFHFMTYVKQFRGVGRGLKRALGDWYNEMPVEKLAYEVVKYQSRDGWSNADVLRLSHPKTADPIRNAVYKWIVDGWQLEWTPDTLPPVVGAFERCKIVKDVTREIKEFNLSREMLPTESLTRPEVWEALLDKMPMTAMIRNLGNMSKCGLLKPLGDASRLIVDRLHDAEVIKKARIHPIAVLIAMRTYASGKGMKGKGEWPVIPAVVDALDDAFYLAFEQMEPTGKRLLFGIDMSGSMLGSRYPGGYISDLPCGISPAEGAAAMAMACIKLEKEYYVMGFAAEFRDLGLTSKMRLDEAVARTQTRTFGRTDCSLPMQYATQNKLEVDGFIVITDNETYAGSVHPSQALKQYRQKSGIDAKEVIIGMTSTLFSIADPNDPRTLDVAGFDASVPAVIGEFLGK